ncbi:hypothetical protein SAMN04487969_109152 [Paenibacillus algorifonticola]|uniref:DNA mismatch repair protein n=1 Tax=Paenibacillus algorifonticola TaxID=684063 RepID=A0A1I2EK02_9BACL|nr:hypothetical protein [Paenibacillus algorifonticola]SFE92798.1 hypothetical protein SAMN04487969_109152 [Paenibacillus algorifonticola]
MPGFTIDHPSGKNSLILDEAPQNISRKMVIDLGMASLQSIGSEHICKVCISNSGSCCSGCRHLSDRVGCQLRNTSCTAWLCGFIKYVLYETGYLQEWNDFWEQVPGQDFREDYTPDTFLIQKNLRIPSMRSLSEALAADLQELAQTHIAIGFILTLREKLDKNIDQFMYYNNEPGKQARIRKRIEFLSLPFDRFHLALHDFMEKRGALTDEKDGLSS